ncbi:hypothetical protein ABIA30_001271 [Mycobacterium sp. MAA66]|uniref:RsiV family protein n=1 Tax=Mycobacterium sp. MAA66 TaxID=3156297 RepID=UPI0035177FF2
MCSASVTSKQGATMNIAVALPDELMDDPTAGPVLQAYSRDLVDGWRKTGELVTRDNTASAEYQLYSATSSVKSVVYHELFQTQGTLPNDAYRTFTFDLARGKRLDLVDLFAPGVDPLTAIPPLARPYLIQALDQASPPHQPNTYPFILDKWEPHLDGSGFSGNYRAFALTPDELILYMPDAPMSHENPPQPGEFRWSMDGGTVTVRIPLAVLKPLLRP